VVEINKSVVEINDKVVYKPILRFSEGWVFLL